MIPAPVLSQACSLFGLPNNVQFFAKSHEHSRSEIWHTGNHLLKITPICYKDEYLELSERIRFARFLTSHGVPCQSFVRSLKGQELEIIANNEDTYLCQCWLYIEAKKVVDAHPMELRTFYQEWAMLLARTHKLSKLYKSKHSVTWLDEWTQSYQMICDAEVKKCFRYLRDELSGRIAGTDNFGFIHNDAHPKNILISEKGLCLIDFDRACRHFYIADIANAIYSEYSRIGFHSQHKDAFKLMPELFLRPFINSYLAHYPLPQKDLEDIELFILYRSIVMFGIFYQEILRYDPQYLAVFRENIIQRRHFLDVSLRDLIY